MKSSEVKSHGFSTNSRKGKLKTFDSNGRIYFPRFIRELFKGYYFSIEVVDGKILLDPVKIEDFEENEGGRKCLRKN